VLLLAPNKQEEESMRRGILRAMLATGIIFGLCLPASADEIAAEEVIVGTQVEPAPAVAAVQPEKDRSGPFLGLGISYFIEEFPKIGQTNLGRDYRTDFDDSWGFNLRGGYRFNDYLAAEGVMEYADGYSSKVSLPPAGLGVDSETIDDSRWSIDFALNAKAILPLGRFEPYVSGGIGFLYMNELKIEELEIPGEGRSKLSQSDDPVVFMGRVAAGVDFAINDTFGLFAEAAYLMPTSSQSDFNAIAVNFGGRLTF
jgi:opacity protein-like surface antigen